MSRHETWANVVSRGIAALGVVTGAGCGLFFFLKVAVASNGYISIQRGGYLMLLVAYCAPFVLGVVSLFWDNLAQRAGVMLGGGGVIMLFAISTMGIAAGAFFLLGAAMIVGGLVSLAGSILRDWLSGAAIFAIVLVGGSAAMSVLVVVPNDGGCWQTIRRADGTHEQRYFANGIDYPNPPPDLPPGGAVTGNLCRDDIISWPEAALSAGLLALELGLITLLRRTRTSTIERESYAIP